MILARISETVPVVLLICCLVMVLQGLAAPPPPVVPDGPRVEREAWVMGTRMRIVVEATEDHLARAAAEEAIREVEHLEALLSTWKPETEMSVANRAPTDRPVLLSSELSTLLVEVWRWRDLTSGAFDPVTGALVDAWDFRGPGRIPTPGVLSDARAASGPGALELHVGAETPSLDAPAHLIRRHPEAWIDAGGFGKGAALRSASRQARDAGADRHLLDLGGQLQASGPDTDPWEVAVAHPTRRTEPYLTLLVQNVSVATSGTSERRVQVDGQLLGHILDPRTGHPSPAWGTVTVVHPDPLVADILSTALYVMGPEEGLRWLEERPGIAALFLEVRRTAPGVEEVMPSWNRAMESWLDPASVPDRDAKKYWNPQMYSNPQNH